jgi:hypothetical protein
LILKAKLEHTMVQPHLQIRDQSLKDLEVVFIIIQKWEPKDILMIK